MEESCHAARGRVPVIVHVTNPSLDDSLADAACAARAGARAIVVSAPYYYPMTQDELCAMVQSLLDQQALPVILYNIPQMARTEYSVATVEKLMQNPRVIGLKDSSGDVAYHRKLIALARSRPDFRLLVGTEALLAPMVKAGSHGCVGGGANLAPRLLVSLYEAARAGRDAEIVSLQQQLELLGGLFRMNSLARCIGALKAAVRMRGVIDDDRMAPPYLSPSDSDREAVAKILQELDRFPAHAPARSVEVSIARTRTALASH
jgi:4-hydroxy-tetrahydrodipicolinate synthase